MVCGQEARTSIAKQAQGHGLTALFSILIGHSDLAQERKSFSPLMSLTNIPTK